jgi:hypothetical protein
VQGSIIVVSGLPRSGTSLMMRILEAAGVPILQDDARPPDASNPHGYFELSAVRRTARDASWLDDAPGHAVKVIHALLEHLPRDRRYQLILMRRPIEEVVASQDRMLARLGEEAGPLPASRVGAVLAARLAAATGLLDREPCFVWRVVDYPGLISTPEQTIGAVLDFLGLRACAADLAQLVDPSLHHERCGVDETPCGP